MTPFAVFALVVAATLAFIASAHASPPGLQKHQVEAVPDGFMVSLSWGTRALAVKDAKVDLAFSLGQALDTDGSPVHKLGEQTVETEEGESRVSFVINKTALRACPMSLLSLATATVVPLRVQMGEKLPEFTELSHTFLLTDSQLVHLKRLLMTDKLVTTGTTLQARLQNLNRNDLLRYICVARRYIVPLSIGFFLFRFVLSVVFSLVISAVWTLLGSLLLGGLIVVTTSQNPQWFGALCRVVPAAGAFFPPPNRDQTKPMSSSNLN